MLDPFFDAHRFEEIEHLHKQAFAWQPQARIPLGIHVVNSKYAAGLTYKEWLNPEVFLEAQVKFLSDTLEVGSDLLPVIAINHLGDAVLTSMFGARQHMPDTASATLQEVGPSPLPVFTSIEQVADIQMPPMDAGIMSQVEKMVLYYRQHLPDWVQIVGPMPAGAFSAAMELRGSDFLTDIIEQPDLCKRLIVMCAELQARIDRRCCELTNADPNQYPTNFGISGTGLRLGEDSTCNLSPEMIKRFCSPAFRRVNEICGGDGHIHFCSLPHSRFEHIYATLAEMPEVAVVSSQFGFEYYQTHLEELRNRLAVESFYGDAYSYVCEKHGSFKAWADDFVPRHKNESGLVLYMQASSVEEAKELWNIWQKAHRH